MRVGRRLAVLALTHLMVFAGAAATYLNALALAIVLGSSLGGNAAAASCSNTSETINATYPADGGTALSNSATMTLTCSGYTSGTTYYLCNAGYSGPGSGGTTISPYRQLDDGTTQHNKANWQFYTTVPSLTAATQAVYFAKLTGTQLNSGSATFTVVLEVPSGQSLGYGTYSTVDNRTINFKQRTDCADAITTNFTHAITYTVQVPTYCTALTTNTLDFGSISSTTAGVTAPAGLISVNCSNNSPYTVYMGSGSNSSSGTNRMKNVANSSSFLSYGLYSDSAYSNPWTSTNGLAGTGSGSAQNLPVYAKIPAQPTPALGNYTDTVVVDLRY